MKTLLIVVTFLLSGLLLVALAANYYFYKKVLLRLYAEKLDPIGLSVYPDTVSPDANHEKRLLMFYGDSRALSWTSPKLAQYRFINRAIGGQTSSQIRERFQAHVIPHRPDIIVLQLCVNDLKMIPLFPHKKSDIIKNCKTNLQQIIQEAHKINARVIISTVFPLGDISIAHKVFGMKKQPIMDAIDDVNYFIQSLASDKTDVFNAYQILKKTHGRKIDKRYSQDWLHLNKQGYDTLNKGLKALIND
jgi:lysophospholipase L1-like esterase